LRRFLLPSKRLLAIAGAAALGLAGAVAFAAPASAHFGKIFGTVGCVDGKPVVHWTVRNDDPHTMTVTGLSAPIGQIVNNATLDKNGSLTGDQTVEAGESADLTFHPTWSDGYAPREGRDPKGHVDVPAWQCKTLGAVLKSSCDTSGVVTLHNPFDREAKFRVTPNGAQTKILSVDKKSDLEVKLDAGFTKVNVWWYGLPEAGKDFTWEKPKDCGVPALTSTSDCNELKITVTNPADGKDANVAVAVGTTEKKAVTLKPGEKVIVEIGRVDNLVAKVTINEKTTEVKYQLPTNCGATLPVTGTNTALVAGGAAVLLSSGAGLFVVARRRRIRFTA